MATPIFDFPVLSFGPVDLGPGQRSYKDSVWEETPAESWKPGEWLGEVEIHEGPKDGGAKTFVARFRFNDGTNIAVTGDLPGEQNWIGPGTGWALGAGNSREIPVEGRNPKRWG